MRGTGPRREKEVFRRHFQVYLREHSAFTGKRPVDGVFDYTWFDLYWREPAQRWPFWARAGDDIAALAFVRRDEEDGYYEMAEFFVVEQYRREGLGDHFAGDIILRFEGRWKLNQVKANARATAFWRRVIGGIADYTETPLRRANDVERIEQRFVL